MISGIDWNQVIVALAATIPATLTAYAAYKQSKQTHLAVNSRMTELLELTRKAAADDATLIEKRAETARKAKTPKVKK